ncbi:MAG: Na+/H+ antiporter NhaA [Acidobacteriales bacterium]|nr:Na+/H+ antiporter NhaA [Terriglobales bacterium]
MAIPARSQGILELKARRSRVSRAVVLPVQQFIHTQGVSGFALMGAAGLALFLANSRWAPGYFAFWEIKAGFDLGFFELSKSLHHWINDGLMAIFFFLVGLEIKHEFVQGELNEFKKATLPVAGALGGMIVPALLFTLLNFGTPGLRGWAIPMATDIAFALGVLALVSGCSPELKVFLLALAIADDIGAIAVIAVFYTSQLSIAALGSSLLPLALIYLARKLGVRSPLVYVPLGILFWLAVLKSGVHATIAGVILGMMADTKPWFDRADFEAAAKDLLDQFRRANESGDYDHADAILGTFEALTKGTEAPVQRITRLIHGWVSFVVLPIFAFANAGVALDTGAMRATLGNHIAWGVALGLVVGKPIGIVLFSWLAVRAGISQLPRHTSWRQMTGVGVLGGIGFTVSIFITTLAYQDAASADAAKIAILISSVVAGILGFFALKMVTPGLSGKREE